MPALRRRTFGIFKLKICRSGLFSFSLNDSNIKMNDSLDRPTRHRDREVLSIQIFSSRAEFSVKILFLQHSIWKSSTFQNFNSKIFFSLLLILMQFCSFLQKNGPSLKVAAKGVQWPEMLFPCFVISPLNKLELVREFVCWGIFLNAEVTFLRNRDFTLNVAFYENLCG